MTVNAKLLIFYLAFRSLNIFTDYQRSSISLLSKSNITVNTRGYIHILTKRVYSSFFPLSLI